MTENEYMRIYMKNRYKKRREEALSFLGGKCVECGKLERLEFDHINPEDKKFTIAEIWTHSKEKFWKEIVKCQLLCKDCHNKKTQRENGKQVAKGKHGTISTYKYCRCEDCKKAKRDYWIITKDKYNKIRREKRRSASLMVKRLALNEKTEGPIPSQITNEKRTI